MVDKNMKMSSYSIMEELMGEPAQTFGDRVNPNFAEFLLEEARDGKKRDRTEAAISAAASRLLDHVPLSALTIAEISKAANVAVGTFYIYFPDRNALLESMLLRFVGFMQITMLNAARSAEEGRRVWLTTAAYYDLFASNPGLIKCLVNRSEDVPQATRVFQKLNHEWITTVVASLRRRGQGADLTGDELFRRAYAMGGMVDQYLTALLLNGDPDLARLSGDRETTISTLSDLWKKGLTA
jgi:AcrR family transcriptional regulator